MPTPKRRRRRLRNGQQREIGRGDYCYIRQERSGSCTVFRFRTLAETEAAMRKGVELDSIVGSPPEVVRAILAAASEARRGLNN